MAPPSPYHQIGLFVIKFQYIETQLTDLLELMVDAPDSEFVRILGTDLEYRKRVEALDVVFARFVDLRRAIKPTEKDQFHKLMQDLLGLGERRNDIVHSTYTPWVNIEGADGLIREKAKLKPGKGQREIKEEELLPESFDADLKCLINASQELEQFRMKIIDWLYPETAEPGR